MFLLKKDWLLNSLMLTGLYRVSQKAGIIWMAKRALAFARERYAYTDGDAQRVKNQQIVIQAMISKIASPENDYSLW